MSVDDIFDVTKHAIDDAASVVEEKAKDVVDGAVEIVGAAKDEIIETVDQNGDSNIDIQDVIILALKTPGVGIHRDSFLSKELKSKYSDEIVAKAIESTPLKAGISREDVDKIVDQVIKYERYCVSGISTALGMPGGVAMTATIPADIAQYYGYMLRAAQKMLYLYGFQDIEIGDEGPQFDSETMNTLILCMGVMYGVAGANKAIQAMAKALARGVEKQLINKALTKGTIYPIVKQVSKWFGVKMTKEVFAGFFKKAIPVIGGVIGGGITFLTFEPCCKKLQHTLRDTILSNPDYKEDPELETIEIIEEDTFNTISSPADN